MWKKLSALLIPTVLLVTQSFQAIAQQSQPPSTPPPSPPPPPQWYGPGPWHMWADGYGWHFWWMGPLMMLFMIFICVAIIHFLFNRHSTFGGPHHWGARMSHMMDRDWYSSHSALQILDERYARGEIQKEEYEERKATILSGRSR